MSTITKGARVKVTALADETANPDYLNREGTVIRLQVGGARDIGATEQDPFIHVVFDDGTVEPFWSEELTLV
jgi:hypothetical protein